MMKKSALAAAILLITACGGGGSSDGGSEGDNNDNVIDRPEPSLPLTQNQRYDLLYRTTFGPTPTSYDTLASMGYDQWLDAQFEQPTTSHRARLEAYRQTGKDLNQGDRASVWWDIIINGDDQLRQRVAFALSEIFVISRLGSGLNSRPETMAHYYDMLADNAFGNFRQLLEDVTLHPAMGEYLSMMANQKADPTKNRYPDENYAREVMQLFSIGLHQLNQDGSAKTDTSGNLIPTYTQDDIEELAKVFTGWHLADKENDRWNSKAGNWETAMIAYDDYHETSTKTVLDEVFPAGQSPEQDMAQAMDMLFNHTNTGPFIAKLLIQRLTTSNPSPAYIERVANTFADNGDGERGDMRAVIKAILLDDEVLSADGQLKLKEPLIAMANLYRATDANANNPEGRFFNNIATFSAYGQSPLGSPSVFNFFSPTYQPNSDFVDQEWVAPEFEILTWNNFITTNNQMWTALFRHKDHNDPKPEWIVTDLAPFKALLESSAVEDGHNALLDELSHRFLKNRMSEELRTIISDAIAQERDDKIENKVKYAIYLVVTSNEFNIEGSQQ